MINIISKMKEGYMNKSITKELYMANKHGRKEFNHLLSN